MEMHYGSYGSSHGVGVVPIIVGVAFWLLMVASMWRVFAKAGQPGWAAIIPIYNVIVLLQIAQKPVWWLVLFFVPIVSIVVPFLVAIGVANSFGKGAGFGIGLVLLAPIFGPILAFGSAQYVGAPAPIGMPMARAGY